MTVKINHVFQKVQGILEGDVDYIFLLGDCNKILDIFPESIIDCVVTSPPYWQMREYEIKSKHKSKIIGNEKRPEDYVKNVASIFKKIKKILKPEGSVWLNIGDKYVNKNLMGMPWRVALAMQEDGWILRNDIIWDQMKGTQSAKDRLRDSYEHIFHFIKRKKYYYAGDSIRIKHKKLPVIYDNKIISATGVSGVKYRKQIRQSPHLSQSEKENALKELDETLQEIKKGKVVDFRMTIRGIQRTYHSNSVNISGRAKELEKNGFFILKSGAKGYLPSDIWRIVPEDKWRGDVHYAVFPEELLEIPIKATCPKNGIVLDPFCGIGSAMISALRFEKRGIGIDISEIYLNIAKKRIAKELVQQRKLF